MWGVVREAPAPPLGMRSPVAPLLLAGLASSGLALLPVLARELESDSVRESLETVLSQPLDSFRSPTGVDASTKPSRTEATQANPSGTTPEAAVAPVPLPPPVPAVPQPAVVAVSTGEASWYGPGFYGNRTANGEVFRPGTLTAAHRTLPFGTKVRVTNLWNGRSAVVRINDRGPFHGRRVIDLAHGAANQLGLVASGIAQVRLEVLR